MVQGSSVPSECVFSSGGLTGTRLCGQLSPHVFEALQLLKSGYWNGHIGAAEQANAHYAVMKEVLDILEDETDDEA